MSKLNPKQQIFADEYIIGKVYLITNKLNGKKYVGITTRKIKERFREHCLANSAIGKAIQKYGEENFTVVGIDTADNHVDLFNKEVYWISKHESFGEKGYNLTLGGGGSFTRKRAKRPLLSDNQKLFVQEVNEYNKQPIDLNNQGEGMMFVLLNAVQIYLLCEYDNDLKSSVKLISKFSSHCLSIIDSWNIIDLKEVYDYQPQKKSNLGVYLSNEHKL